MILGMLLSFLLRNPREVIKADGTLVGVKKLPNWQGEVKGLLKTLTEWKLGALIPLFIYSNWFYTYEFAVYNAGTVVRLCRMEFIKYEGVSFLQSCLGLFNTRSQGLDNSLFWGAQLVGAILIGGFLDSKVKFFMSSHSCFVLIT